MAKGLQPILSRALILSLVLSVFILAFGQAPTLPLEGATTSGTPHGKIQIVESQNSFDPGTSARQTSPSQRISSSALAPSMRMPSPHNPTTIQFERLQPYRLPGARPLPDRLILVQKTSADL
jgi:hypothetical protein